MVDKVRVIQLIEEISDGGAETQLKNYMLHLDKAKFNTIVLTKYVDASSANVRILLNKKSPIRSAMIIKRNIWTKILNKLQRVLIGEKNREQFYQWYIQKQILSFKPDVIHVHLKMLHYLVPIAEQLKGVKLFYRCASKPDRFFNNETVLDISEFSAAKFLIKNVGLQMVALHNQMRDAINELFNIDNTLVIHNVFDLEKFKSAVNINKNQIRRQLGIPEDALVIGHIGRFCQVKNQTFLVDVFKEVSDANTQAFLLMIGSGDYSDIEKRIESYGLSDKYVILCNRSDVNELLHAMDIFIFPSYYEGMPGALIEAQAAGLKCIASSAITSEAIVSSRAIQMNLSDGANMWANRILKDEFDGKIITDIASFGVQKVMESVECLYGL